MVSHAISGDLGRQIGRRRIGKDYSDAIKLEGVIELWHGDTMVISEKFGSRAYRKTIIEKWKSNYQLQNKHGISFIIRYL